MNAGDRYVLRDGEEFRTVIVMGREGERWRVFDTARSVEMSVPPERLICRGTVKTTYLARERGEP